MKTKMTGKQAVKGGMDLESFVKGADPVPQAQNEPVTAFSVSSDVPVVVQPKRGRGVSPVASEELKSRNLQVRLTEKEYSALKSQSGLIPVATFVRDQMKSKGII